MEQLDLDLVIGFRQKGKILKALGAWFEYGLLNIGIGCCGLQSKNCGNQLYDIVRDVSSSRRETGVYRTPSHSSIRQSRNAKISAFRGFVSVRVLTRRLEIIRSEIAKW